MLVEEIDLAESSDPGFASSVLSKAMYQDGSTLSSRLWTRDALRVLPRSVMGVPSDLDQLESTGIIGPDGMVRLREETRLPMAEDDVSVAEFVGSRLGSEVVDRLLEPLLGGGQGVRGQPVGEVTQLHREGVAQPDQRSLGTAQRQGGPGGVLVQGRGHRGRRSPAGRSRRQTC